MTSPVLSTTLDPDRAKPQQSWLTVSDLLEHYPLHVAREVCNRLLRGGIVQRGSEPLQLLSCPLDQRGALERQIGETFESRVDSQALRSMDAQQRLQLAHRAHEPGVLAQLAGDRRSHRVRQGVAINPHTDEATVVALADDAHPAVRRAAAAHPQLPAGVADLLSHDPAPEVRLAIAARKMPLPDSTWERLLQDPHPRVLHMALNNAHTPTQLVDQRLEQLVAGGERVQLKLAASCPRLGRKQLQQIAEAPEQPEDRRPSCFNSHPWGTPSRVAKQTLTRMGR